MTFVSFINVVIKLLSFRRLSPFVVCYVQCLWKIYVVHTTLCHTRCKWTMHFITNILIFGCV